MEERKSSQWSFVEFGEKLFKWRDYTPIALLILLVIVARPTVLSATLGCLLIILGEAIRMCSVAFIGPVSRTRSESTGAQLVKAGPYGVVRNPIYVGNFVITMGVASFGGVLWFVLLTLILFAVQYFAIVQFEENLLEEKFGEEFRVYRESVPAWFPRSWPKDMNWQWPLTMGEVLNSEKRTLLAIVVVVGILIMKAPTTPLP